MGFWELMAKIDPPAVAIAGLLGIGFVLVVFVLAAVIIGTTKASSDVEIVRMRFAQVLFVGIITTLVFSSILYLFSRDDGPGARIFDRIVTAMTPLAGVVIGYLFGSRTDRGAAEQRPGDRSFQASPATPADTSTPARES